MEWRVKELGRILACEYYLIFDFRWNGVTAGYLGIYHSHFSVVSQAGEQFQSQDLKASIFSSAYEFAF
jgi:hypothetical protein